MSDHVDPLSAVRSLAAIVHTLVERMDAFESYLIALIRRVEQAALEAAGIESPEYDGYENDNEV